MANKAFCLLGFSVAMYLIKMSPHFMISWFYHLLITSSRYTKQEERGDVGRYVEVEVGLVIGNKS